MKHLRKALRETYGYKLQADIDFAEKQPEHSFSENHNRKMKEFIGNRRKPIIGFFATAGVRAACIVIVGLIISVSVMQVDAIRVPLVEALKEPFRGFSVKEKDDNTDNRYISFEDPDMTYKTEAEVFYRLTFIPDGYKLVDLRREDNLIMYFYMCGEEEIYFAQYMKCDYKDAIIGPDCVITEIEDNGVKYTLFEERGVKCFLWEKDDYVLHINVPDSFTVEEGLELCRSVVPE